MLAGAHSYFSLSITFFLSFSREHNNRVGRISIISIKYCIPMEGEVCWGSLVCGFVGFFEGEGRCVCVCLLGFGVPFFFP